MPNLHSLTLVIPLYNEEESIPNLQEAIEQFQISLAGINLGIVLVNDGSRDATARLIDAWAEQNVWVTVLHFSRNFGHQVAVTAGLDHVPPDSEAAVIMDGDLQDPLDVVREMVNRYNEGGEVIYGRRRSRAGETWFKRLTAYLFYRVMRALVDPGLPPDTGDFRLLSRPALNALNSMRERHRFLRGMSNWIGFKQVEVLYDRPARVFGETKYPLRKMLAFAWNAAVSFSAVPLRLSLILGSLVSFFGVGYTVYSVLRFWLVGDTARGWPTMVVLLCLIGGSILVCLGIIGEYVARIYEEIKGRPLYIIRDAKNLTTSFRS